MVARQFELAAQLAEVPRLVGWIGSCCAAAGLDEDAIFRLTLAVEEAVVNVIAHGLAGLPSPPPITVRLVITGRSVAVEIIDAGPSFDPTSAPDPDLSLSLDDRSPGGLGIHLMRRMVDRLRYRRRAGRNILRLESDRQHLARRRRPNS